MHHWLNKFRCALRGCLYGTQGQTSFYVHLPMAGLVWATAAWLRCSLWQWIALTMCIALVLSLELMNSAIEHLARGLCNEQNQEVGRALDIASAAVLIASLFSAAIGLTIFSWQLWVL